MVVQVNGKVRDRIEVAAGIDEADGRALALASPKVVAAAGRRDAPARSSPGRPSSSTSSSDLGSEGCNRVVGWEGSEA